MSVKLHRIAHARAGDKGDTSMISLIAYDAADYAALSEAVTVERVRAHFADMAVGLVERYELPRLAALNFVLHEVLTGGVTRSLSLDGHGKALGACLLEMEIELERP